jgi:hypothetical protein
MLMIIKQVGIDSIWYEKRADLEGQEIQCKEIGGTPEASVNPDLPWRTVKGRITTGRYKGVDFFLAWAIVEPVEEAQDKAQLTLFPKKEYK